MEKAAVPVNLTLVLAFFLAMRRHVASKNQARGVLFLAFDNGVQASGTSNWHT